MIERNESKRKRPCQFCGRLLSDRARANGLGRLLDAGIVRTYRVVACLYCARVLTSHPMLQAAVQKIALGGG